MRTLQKPIVVTKEDSNFGILYNYLTVQYTMFGRGILLFKKKENSWSYGTFRTGRFFMRVSPKNAVRVIKAMRKIERKVF